MLEEKKLDFITFVFMRKSINQKWKIFMKKDRNELKIKMKDDLLLFIMFFILEKDFENKNKTYLWTTRKDRSNHRRNFYKKL